MFQLVLHVALVEEYGSKKLKLKERDLNEEDK